MQGDVSDALEKVAGLPRDNKLSSSSRDIMNRLLRSRLEVLHALLDNVTSAVEKKDGLDDGLVTPYDWAWFQLSKSGQRLLSSVFKRIPAPVDSTAVVKAIVDTITTNAEAAAAAASAAAAAGGPECEMSRLRAVAGAAQFAKDTKVPVLVDEAQVLMDTKTYGLHASAAHQTPGRDKSKDTSTESSSDLPSSGAPPSGQALHRPSTPPPETPAPNRHLLVTLRTAVRFELDCPMVYAGTELGLGRVTNASSGGYDSSERCLVTSFPTFDGELVEKYLLTFLKFPGDVVPFDVQPLVGRPRWVTMLVQRPYRAKPFPGVDAAATETVNALFGHYEPRLGLAARATVEDSGPTPREALVQAAYKAVMMNASFNSAFHKTELPEALRPTPLAARRVEELLCTFEHQETGICIRIVHEPIIVLLLEKMMREWDIPNPFVAALKEEVESYVKDAGKVSFPFVVPHILSCSWN